MEALCKAQTCSVLAGWADTLGTDEASRECQLQAFSKAEPMAMAVTPLPSISTSTWLLCTFDTLYLVLASTAASRAAAANMVATGSASVLLRRAPTLALASAPPLRSLHSTRTVRASSSSSASAADDDFPAENFGAPIWRYTFLGAIAAFGLYRVSTLHAEPHPSKASSSGRSAPGNQSSDDLHHDQPKPWLTRYIQHWTTPTSVWRERNARHLELVKEKAEERLLFQDAERPPVHRLRYTEVFEQASPHAVAPGSQVDLSDLKIKRASE